MPLSRIRIWLDSILNDSRVSLQVRLFRMACVILTILLWGVIMPTNIILGLPWQFGLASGGLGLLLAGIFYASLRGHHFIRLTFNLCLCLLNAAWFINAGLYGSIPSFFFPLIVFALVLLRSWERWVGVFLLAVNFGVLVVLGELYPDLVRPYQSAEDRLLDLLAGFAVTLAIVGAMIQVMVSSHEHQLEEARRAEKAKLLLNNKMRAILDNLPMMAWFKDTEGRLELVNLAYGVNSGRKAEDCIGLTDLDLFPPELARASMETDQLVCQTGERSELEETIATPAGMRVALFFRTPVRDGEGRVVGTTGIALDITDRRMADERLRSTLAEKEVLIAELYHRTKNNMQVISGMMEMQRVFFDDHHLQMVFRNMDLRIQSMALVQRRLFESKDLSNINLREYLVEQCFMLLQSYAIAGERVVFDLSEVQDVRMILDIAIPFGMVCNEILSNSLCHGYPDGRTGRISLCLRRLDDQMVMVSLVDDGIGVPPGFDFQSGSGLGLKMARALAEQQLQGRLEIECQGGVRSTLVFKTSMYRNRV